MELRHKYDAIPSPYRYVASGTIIGFAGALKQMTEEGIYGIEYGFSHGNHQGLVGKYVYDHFDDAVLVRLDTQCQLFWVTSDDTQLFSESPFVILIRKQGRSSATSSVKVGKARSCTGELADASWSAGTMRRLMAPAAERDRRGGRREYGPGAGRCR
jgi:hypothetical protein